MDWVGLFAPQDALVVVVARELVAFAFVACTVGFAVPHRSRSGL